MKKRKSGGAWERKLLALAVASCFGGELAQAAPSGGKFVNGGGSISQNGATTTVVNTPGAIINWQSFGIASQEIVRFLQQSAASKVLNRVTGDTPSAILGQLQSNGRVYLINPNGITIGKNAVIDVAGFVASTHKLSNDDFLAGRHRFQETPGAASVVNHGEITTASGGMVYLVGQNVENHGVIRTPQGEIILAAGKSIELVDAGTPEIRVQIKAPDNQALNLGQLLASGGRIGMYGGLVRHGGIASANTAVVGESGKIVFKATQDVKLDAGSVSTASGPNAGSIKVEAQNGMAVVAGTAEANATAGRGGSIDISGQQGVTIEPTGRVSAEGVHGGPVALNSSAGGVQVSGQLSTNAISGRGGQIAMAAATQASVAAGAKVSASGPKGGGSISVDAIESIMLESDSRLEASGSTGGTIRVASEEGSVEVNGTVEATGATFAGGAIKISALSNITLGDASVLNASGKRGGETWIEAREGTTLASGLIDAYGHDGTGGKVLLLGPRVGLLRNAVVNASGYTRGGTVLVGGDYQGKNPYIQNAERTYVGPGVRIVADAIDSGNGGKIVIWSDEITRYYGEIRARGGARSGNGGLVEVSGKQLLHFNGKADVRALRGRDGTVLLDPRDIVVQDSASAHDGQVTASSDERILFADGASGDFTISDEALEALQGSIVLQATRDITINAGLSGGGLVLLNQGAAERVVFQAGRHITIGSPVKTHGASIWLESDSPHTNGYPTAATTTGADGRGSLRINASVQSFDSDPATGGKITMIAGTNTQGGTNGGGFDLKADVNGGAGGIDVALSNQLVGELSFLIGSQGQAQFTTSDTGRLMSTGQLKIGEATTAGTNGLGLDAQTIKVDQLSLGATAGGPVTLAETAGTSLVLTAGSGGILVERPLSTNQPTSIETTGPLTINQPVTTNGETLSISAASISGADQITGTGTISCTGTGCPGGTVILWDGGGGNLDWFTAANWSGNVVPTSADAVELHSSSGTVLISGGAALVKSLIADVPISISGTGSLTLAQASQFTEGFTLSGSLLGTGVAAVSGNTGNLTWNGGTMGTGGAFTLGVGASGTFSGSLTLNRTFLNSSVLTLSGATLGGTGTLQNTGTLSALGTNVVSVGLNNPINALIQVQGALTVSNFPINHGRITVVTGGTFSTNGASLANSATSSLVIDAGNFSSAEATVTTDGSGNLAVDGALSAGTITLVAAGSGGVILASGATVTASAVGDTIVISGTNFTNNAGSSALNPGSGRWLVYSANPEDNDFDGLLSGNQAIWGRGYPTGVTETGNRYVFSAQPTLTFTSTDAVKAYGTAADVSGNYNMTGFVDASLHGGVFTQDTLSNTFVGAPTVTSAGAGATAHRADGNLGLGLFSIDASVATVTPTTGYAVASSSAGQLTVNPVVLTVTGPTIGGTTTKSYDGATAATGATLTGGGISGAIAGDTLLLNTGGVTLDYNSSHVVGATTISATGSAGLNIGGSTAGSQASDYSFSAPTIASVSGSITPKALTVTGPTIGGTTTKTYDGATAATGATLTGGGISGAIAGDTLLLNTSGVTLDYNSSHVVGATTISATGSAGLNISASAAGSQATDYSFSAPTIASVSGSITPKALTVTAGNASKTYGQVVTFSGSAFTSTGLVAGETIGGVTLTSAGAPANAGVTGSPYALVPSAAQGGTFVASDYSISYQNGALTVSPAVINLTVTRLFDGTAVFGSTSFGTVSGVNGETLMLAGDGSVAGPRVRSYTLGLGTLSLTNGTGLASNYTLTGGNHTGTITPDPGNFRWVAGSGGNWDVAANWNQGVVPVGGAIVTIPDVGAPGISETIIYRSGITNVKSIVSSERLAVSGGTLNLGVAAGDVSSIPEVKLAGGTLGGNGTLNVATTELLAGGVLTGSRTVVGNVNNSAGTVVPGNSPGILTIDGNYTQGALGTLAIEIAGPTPGTQHDQLVVTGNATLGGTLRVSLPGGYVPAQGATHSVVEAGGTISGTFSTTQYQPALGLTTTYLASSVKVAASATNPGQILNEQVDSTQSAPPNTNAGLGGATPTGSGATVPIGIYLETPSGQVVPLSPVASVDPGVYVNVDTGDTTIIGTGFTPPPGIYLNPETQTVLVVRVNPETGQTEIMSGPSSDAFSAVGSGARVRRVAACM